MLALVKLALEPEWEAKFEPNSYGFRPGRSCHDAIEAIFISINKKAKYVLDADIAKCFDRIDHEALLNKLRTSPTIRRQIRSWLKAGVMDGKQLFPTSEGTPQGGVISPLLARRFRGKLPPKSSLANIALHGMEERIKQEFPKRSPRAKETWFQRKGTSFNAPSIVRYADDFVILHEDITVVQRCQEVISEWLKDMRLELKPSKTRLTHTLNLYENEQPGFNFLGFNVRQHPVGIHQTGVDSFGKKLGYKTIIIPSKEKQKIHYEELASVIDNHKAAPQWALIERLNPKIIGWSNYYSTAVSSYAYSELGHLIYKKLKAWAERRHPHKSKGEVANKYWQTIGGNNWVFATRQEGKNPLRLRSHQETPIIRHVKVKGDASPYDGNLIYWSSRMGKHPEATERVATLLKKQKGKCTHCGLYFREGDVLEVDHIIPKVLGGKDQYNNLQILHKHCHDTKTANESSARKTREGSSEKCT